MTSAQTTSRPTGLQEPPSSGQVFRVAVVSDVHSYSDADPGRAANSEPPSYSRAEAVRSTSLQGNPLDDLMRLVRENSLAADVVLCPGDLANKASVAGLRYSWARLNELSLALGAKHLVSTPGNHDLDLAANDRQEGLKTLAPLFPVADRNGRNQFWADYFTLIEDEGWRVIALDSVAQVTDASKLARGGVTEATLGRLRDVMTALPRKPVQLLLCHHHPHQHSEYALGEHDVMAGGQQLLDLLGRHGDWLVIHGHKHHPKLTHGAGGSSAPWVFAAGSLAALPNPATQGHAMNQFYMVELRPPTFRQLGWGGVIHAWDWAPADGWRTAGPTSGLPARSGFGFLGDLSILVGELGALPPATQGYMQWDDAVRSYPRLARLCPRDIEELRERGLEIGFDSQGLPTQIARRA